MRCPVLIRLIPLVPKASSRRWRKSAPALAGIYTTALKGAGGRALAAYMRAMAEKSPVPVSLILDHGADFEQCIEALSYGFTDVMYDGSKLPFEENLATTRMIVRAAHAVGASVEAELGHVGSGADYESFGAKGKGFTDPEAAARFAAETGVDFLAVAIGTAHGQYRSKPNLALDLLEAIRERVEVPLVLHGGTGLSEDHYEAVIARGVCKINIFTDLAQSSYTRIAELIESGDASYLDLTAGVQQAFYDRCCYYLDLFGASGKAGRF